MSEQEKKVTEQPAAEPAVSSAPKLHPGLFQGFSLGSTLKQGPNGNTITNMKPNPMDYEKAYKESTKNQQLTPEQLAGPVKEAAAKEVTQATEKKAEEKK